MTLQIDPEWYIRACMFDYCALNGDSQEEENAVVCHYLTAYAMEAAKTGIRLVNWRSKDLCGEIIGYEFKFFLPIYRP